jgi:hypothetical protein
MLIGAGLCRSAGNGRLGLEEIFGKIKGGNSFRQHPELSPYTNIDSSISPALAAR